MSEVLLFPAVGLSQGYLWSGVKQCHHLHDKILIYIEWEQDFILDFWQRFLSPLEADWVGSAGTQFSENQDIQDFPKSTVSVPLLQCLGKIAFVTFSSHQTPAAALLLTVVLPQISVSASETNTGFQQYCGGFIMCFIHRFQDALQR